MGVKDKNEAIAGLVSKSARDGHQSVFDRAQRGSGNLESKLPNTTPNDTIGIIEKRAHDSNTFMHQLVDAMNSVFDANSIPIDLRNGIVSRVVEQLNAAKEDITQDLDEFSKGREEQGRSSTNPSESSRLGGLYAAPELFPGATAGEAPPEFIKRVYKPWLGRGLDRAAVRRLDPRLGQALDNWLRKNDMPLDLDLPTAKERTTREIERLRAASESGDPKQVVGNFTLKEAQRIEANIRRHSKSQK